MLKDIWIIYQKDLKLDFRSLENFISMFFFSVIILLIFSFALPEEEKIHQLLSPGIFWVTFLLSGLLSLNKSFQIEKENGCMDAMLMSPVSRGAIFLGKMAENVSFILLIQLILIPVFGLLFYSRILEFYGELMLLGLISSAGFSSLGTLLSGMTTDLRFKEILLPVLLFPLLVPLLLASVKITQAILLGDGFQGESDWLKLLLGFDGIFVIISYLTFDFVMEL
jgi:heme exporter protein B